MFSKTKIAHLEAREILDSRGNPTVACRVVLSGGASAEARVPSGASTGSHEALELRDGGRRYGGKGVLKAVGHVNAHIASALRRRDAADQRGVDARMLALDGTANKSNLGANATLAVSLACAQAVAAQRGLPLWKSLRQAFRFPRPATLPLPFMNLLNGGAHAGWAMDVQECMVVPRQTKFSERLRAGAEIFHALKGLLAKKGLATTVGDEGGFAPALAKAEDSFDLLLLAIQKAGYRAGKDVVLAADVAASEMYDKKKKAYAFKAEGRSYTAPQLLERYCAWQSDYPFFSIEDPFAEDDWSAWSAVVREIGKKTWFVGDDLFVTNPERLAVGIEKKAATALLVKPNQIGTLSETVDAILLAQSHGMRTIISHRSGETSDTTVADLAVASGSEGIKTGSLSRSERIEKYNRLLAIERELAD